MKAKEFNFKFPKGDTCPISFDITDADGNSLDFSSGNIDIHFTITNKNNVTILRDICEMVILEAAQWTNRLPDEKLLNDCWPIIVKCSCMAYLNRGAEGIKSQSELGQQNVFSDCVTLMHQQITNRRYVL